MALTKSQRIIILLGIDGAFFLLELIVGYSTHSLALVADAFHMLNDVLSLCVGLWAVNVANQKTNSKMYTYGWQRAETLGALVNGVFLVALCLSIFLEAVQRFFEPQEVGNPRLVLIVGVCGLLSNILGLFLFHEHSHGHGHDHGDHGDEHTHIEASGNETAAEEGRALLQHQQASYGTPTTTTLKSSPKDDGDDKNNLKPCSSEPVKQSATSPDRLQGALRQANTTDLSTTAHPPSPFSPSRRNRPRGNSGRSRHSGIDEIPIHPASFRNEIIAASRMESIESEPASEAEGSDEERRPDYQRSSHGSGRHGADSKDLHDSHHASHKHRKPKSTSDKHGGHSHGDLNMRGVFLHVLGDALGNIGVIASALFIWQTNYSWRFYSDPLISLIITVIILGSAIPLCRAASRILLQAVPAGISVDDIKEDIEDLPGVVSCHHLHVWQLSDTKLIASLHIQVAFDYRGTDAKQYMCLAKAVRTCLHEYGIHSSTIQPEFCLDTRHQHAAGNVEEGDSGARLDSSTAYSRQGSKLNSRAASILSVPDACLLDCGDDCARGRGCCPTNNGKSSGSDH